MSSGLSHQYTITVLKEGTLFEENGVTKGGSSIAVLSGPHNILINTGLPKDRENVLLQGLEKNRLKPDDIEYVVCTDGSVENIGNLNLFPYATLIVGFCIMKGDNHFLHDFTNSIPFEIDDDVEVIATPGMHSTNVSLIVTNTQLGTVALAGGVFGCEGDLETPELWVEKSFNPDAQLQSRIDILKRASYILPRYGAVFRVPDEYKGTNMQVVITP